jgi:hypothetical protein
VWTAADQGLIAWTEDPAGRHGRADRFGERVLDGIVIAKPGIASMASISPDHHRFHYGVRNEGFTS